MRKVVLCGMCAAICFLLVSGVQAYSIDLTGGRGVYDDWLGAYFIEFTDEMQTTVSSGTGVIDPFLTIQKKDIEEGFNSDARPLVQDTNRPQWNHSIQISDLILSPILGYSTYYEFLLDINEPAETSLITQHELEVYVVENSVGGAIDSYSNLKSLGTLIWSLDGLDDLNDSQILYDYNLWFGSGQNFDTAFLLDMDLFSGYSLDDYVYLYAQFGELNGIGHPSADGFEEYALREGGTPIPEPTTMLLLGMGMIGMARLRKRTRK